MLIDRFRIVSALECIIKCSVLGLPSSILNLWHDKYNYQHHSPKRALGVIIENPQKHHCFCWMPRSQKGRDLKLQITITFLRPNLGDSMIEFCLARDVDLAWVLRHIVLN